MSPCLSEAQRFLSDAQPYQIVSAVGFKFAANAYQRKKGATQMTWSVSRVMRTGGRLGHSFSVINPHREPLLTLAFETAAEADRARAILEAELAALQLPITEPILLRPTAINDNREPGRLPLSAGNM